MEEDFNGGWFALGVEQATDDLQWLSTQEDFEQIYKEDFASILNLTQDEE